jgi:outer membrane lipoprotein-sorting protein
MRWLFIVLGVLLGSGELRAQDPKKLFSAMERKMIKAKAERITFEVDASDKGGPIKIKGTLIVAAGNRLRLVFEGTQGRGKPSKVTWVSDGKAMAIQTVIGDNKVKVNLPMPNKLHPLVGGTIARASVVSTINGLTAPKPIFPDRLKPTFQKASKDKVGEKNAILIHYQIITPEAGNLMVCKLWLDEKTNLPMKRIVEVSRGGETLLRTAESYSEWELDPKLPKETFELPE